MKIIVGVAVLLLLPTAALAQGNPGPFGGLFGRTPERIGKEYRVFELRSLTMGQLEDPLNDGENTRQPSSWIGNGGLRGLFEQRSSRLQFSAVSYVNYLQYFRAPSNGGTSVASTAVASFKAASRLTLDAAASHTYTPFFQFHPNFYSWTPEGLLVPPSTPYVATAIETQSYSALGGMSIPYSKRSTVGASVERRETRFDNRPDADLSVFGMRGWWTRQLNREMQLKLGYGRERAEQMPGAEYVLETIDAGLSFARPITRDRRTTLALHAETARIGTPLYGRHFRVNGHVQVTRWFNRTWLLDVYGHRATDFVPGFVEPLNTDTVGASVSGLLSRRVEFVVQANAGRGEFGFESLIGPSAMGVALTQFSFAVTRKIGVFAQHHLFYFDSPQTASTVAPVSHFARQTMTFGMTAWIPIYTRERSPSDTR